MDDNTPLKTKLPDKLYFKIGEVSAIVGLPPYVLRFWESEFSQIKPKRTPSGQRVYTKSDVEIILKVKNLLYNQKYTIPGAKQYLKAKPREKKGKFSITTLDEIYKELENIRDILDGKMR